MAQTPVLEMGESEKDQSLLKGIIHLLQQQQMKEKKGREVAVEADKNPTHPLKEIRMPNATRGASPPFPRIQVMRTWAGGSSRIFNLTKWCPAGSDAS